MASRIWSVESNKHPGAVFLKRAHTDDGFICKVYPGNKWEARVIKAALEQAYADEYPMTEHEQERARRDWRTRA